MPEKLVDLVSHAFMEIDIVYFCFHIGIWNEIVYSPEKMYPKFYLLLGSNYSNLENQNLTIPEPIFDLNQLSY